MYIPDEMKLNRFKAIAMPSARDYFKSMGYQATPGSQYSGEESAPMPQNKVDSMQDFVEYAEQMAHDYERNQNQHENE